MIRYLLLLLVCGITNCVAQPGVKYYKKESLRKEVAPNKAKFSRTITENPDGTVTTEVKDLIKNVLISSETYKGAEPYGTWFSQKFTNNKTLNYNFPLHYSGEKCEKNSLLDSMGIKDLFADADSLNYKAPVMIGGDTTVRGVTRIIDFFRSNLIYPLRAREEGTEGTVYVGFKIDDEGNAEGIHIKRGVNVLLDKEAARVISLLKFYNPPTLNGQKLNVCIVAPVKFRLV